LRCAGSRLAYDSAAYGWSAGRLHGAVLKNVEDSSLEVVLGGCGPLSSNLEVTIVDAAVIDGAKSFRIFVLGNEDRSFRRDFGVGEVDEFVMRIEQNMVFSTIGGFMLTDSFGSFSDVRIDKPKYYVLRGEFAFDALYLGNVAIGDRAIRRNEEEDYGLGIWSGEMSHRLAIQVVAVG
jgi:hypothetical protein